MKYLSKIMRKAKTVFPIKSIFPIGMLILIFGHNLNAKELLMGFDLYWKPTTKIETIKESFDKDVFKNINIKWGQLKDLRKTNPLTRIGENKEDSKDFLPVETQSDVLLFVKTHLSKTLIEVGIDFKNESNASLANEYVLDADLLELFIEETNQYNAKVQILFKLKKANKIIWKDTLNGASSRFGRSYKLDNYMETLADSIIELSKSLITNTDFKKSFQTKKGKN